jgi:hypothetical protein
MSDSQTFYQRTGQYSKKDKNFESKNKWEIWNNTILKEKGIEISYSIFKGHLYTTNLIVFAMIGQKCATDSRNKLTQRAISLIAFFFIFIAIYSIW